MSEKKYSNFLELGSWGLRCGSAYASFYTTLTVLSDDAVADARQNKVDMIKKEIELIKEHQKNGTTQDVREVTSHYQFAGEKITKKEYKSISLQDMKHDADGMLKNIDNQNVSDLIPGGTIALMVGASLVAGAVGGIITRVVASQKNLAKLSDFLVEKKDVLVARWNKKPVAEENKTDNAITPNSDAPKLE